MDVRRWSPFVLAAAVAFWTLLVMVVLMLLINETDTSWKQVMVQRPAGMPESREQLAVTVTDIDRVRRRDGSCNVLVFGLTTHAHFWMQHNPGGMTVFLDEDMDSIERMQKRMPDLVAYPVSYHTQIQRDMNKFRSPTDWALLHMQLHPSVRDVVWNVVIVNGPAGYCLHCPGRFQSLYMSSVLKRPPDGLTVVDDCQRKLESTFAPLFLGNESIFLAIPRTRALTRHVQCFFRPNMAPSVKSEL